MSAGGPVSLRPGGAGVSLRPGGDAAGAASPFSSFAMGSKPQAPSVDNAKRLNSEDVVKYTKEFMMQFKERYTEIPVELATSPLEVVINDVNERSDDDDDDATPGGQWGKKETDGGDPLSSKSASSKSSSDAKDWHAKPTPASEAADRKAGKQSKKQGGRVDLTPLPEGTEGATIVKAANAWSRGGADDDRARVTRLIKGILNKITPEKFDRLMEQLLEAGIDDADILAETISIVFDKAIWEPGFCSMYADVCLRLSKELPEFPSAEPGGKPTTFKRVLLNTCQEEFEGAGKAREELANIADAAERNAATKRVKVRTMGNIKLIGELYKKHMIAEKIMNACVADLLGPPSQTPPEENVEALCNLLVAAGKELEASPKLPKQMMDMYFARLKALSESEAMDSRVRFLCRDVIELRKAEWVPRVKKLEAMTLNEIHAEAAAALGIAPAQAEEILFPEGPGAVGDGWEVVGKGKGSGGGSGSGSGGGKSALSGPYVASKHGDRAMPTEREKAKLDAAARAAAAAKAAAKAAAAAAGEDGGASSSGGGTLNAEKIDAMIDSMIDEYTNVGDVKEAVLCVKEIQKEAKDSAAAITSCASKLVSHVVDLSQEKARDLVIALLAAMVHDCDVPDVVISTALGEPVMALDDIAIDVPMAPKLLGVMTARLVSANALDAAFIKTSAQEIEDVLYRREFAAAAFKELNAEGAKGAKATVDAAGIDVAKLLGGDPEFDSPIGEFLEKQGLKELC